VDEIPVRGRLKTKLFFVSNCLHRYEEDYYVAGRELNRAAIVPF
jgi:hypothetical protein